MSSHLTEQLGLHTWEPEDKFLRSEFNENFEMLDGILVTGSFTGDDQPGRFIDLGFTPRAVLVLRGGTMTATNTYIGGGLALPGSPTYLTNAPLMEVVEGGFRLHGERSSSSFSNTVNHTSYYYNYLALR